MSNEVKIEDAVFQLTNTVLALTNVLAQVAPDLTKGYLGFAIEGSRQSGHGDTLVKEIFQKAFPGAPFPIALSPEEFAAKEAELKR